MINRLKYLYFSFSLFVCAELAAQNLQGLQENPVIKKHLIDQPYKLKSAEDSPLLTLPFFEDFSIISVFPNPAKWTDRDAFINSTFDVDPISIGVATLDAIDENGNLYALTNWPTSSDRLTSQKFDLSSFAFPTDTVRFSFFFQCGGKGEIPELSDSLLLEFYSPIAQTWKTVWDTTMKYYSDFQQVILTVDSNYYKSGFRFRFRNYTSLSPEDVDGGDGALSNVDCWNIDYIMMNTNPISEHRSINDITLTEPPRRLLGFYEIVPWLHMKEAKEAVALNYINFSIRNLELQGNARYVDRNYYVKNLLDGSVISYHKVGNEFPPNSLTKRLDEFFISLIPDEEDDSKEGLLEVVSYLEPTAGQELQNDTTRTILNFKDYYAYDDGSPEYGFGIAGPSMSGALMACRFRVFKQDTLRAIDMLFNKTRNDFNADKGFQLCVWKDKAGKPGERLFISPEIYYPGTSPNIPVFKRFVINSEEDLIITDTTVFVGWQQETEEFLNLGYDLSRNNLSRVYINVGGNWFSPGSSMIPGTMMIRAVFGSKDVVVSNPEIPEAASDVVLYPNPVSGILHIRSDETLVKRISIFDISGRLIIQDNSMQKTLDVSCLSPGMYQVVLTTGQEQLINHKIIISR
jgi:hypothetical protein